MVEIEARSRGKTKSEIVRESLEKTLSPARANKEKSCFDVSKHVVGSLKSGVRDLATNPKYMEGFGE